MTGWQKFTYPVPIHVTRKDADGRIGYWTVGAGTATISMLLIQLNVLLWSVYGAVEAVKAVFGL